MDKRTRKYIINIALILLLTIAVVYFSLKDDYDAVAGLLSRVELPWLMLCLVIAIIYHFMVGFILKSFAKLYNPNYRMKDGIKNAFIAALFHGLTPFASGGQFVQVYVFYKQKINVSDSASILLMDFIVYQLTLVLYTFVLIVLRFNHIASSKSFIFQLALIGFFVNFVIIVSLILLARGKRLHYFLTHTGIHFLAKIHLIKNPQEKINKLHEHVTRFGIELVRLRNNKKLMTKVVAANIIRLTLHNSIPFVALLALGIRLNISGWLDLVALSAFVGMVNAFIPLPGASGGTEGTYLLMFQTMFRQLPRSVGVGSMLIWRFSTYHMILILGLIVFIVFKQRQPIKKIEEEIYENRFIQ